VVELTIYRESKGGDFPRDEGAYHPTSRECEEAISLAEAMLPTIDIKPEDYKLIEAKNLRDAAGVYRGPQFWHLTFKARYLIPSTPKGMLGAGGEIFVAVDLTERRAWVTGYGE